jgi:hypothetical protein
MSDDLEERRHAMNETTRDRHNLISGCLLLAVGAWAAIAPFAVGDWQWGTTSGSFLLTVVPGAAAALGGLVMLAGERRLVSFGGALALLGGVWFSAYALGLVTPLEFADDAPQTAGATRARVPLPAERARRQRGVSEPAPQPANHARGKRSAPRES